MNGNTFIKYLIFISLLGSISNASTIVGKDTFQIGDCWVYKEYRQDCWGIRPPSPRICNYFSGSHSVKIIDRMIISDSTFYILSVSDSGANYSDTLPSPYVRTFYSDTSITQYSSIDTVYSIPFDRYFFMDTIQYIAKYLQDTLILQGDTETSGYMNVLYLQKTGIIFWRSSGATGNTNGYDRLELISINNTPFKLSELQILNKSANLNQNSPNQKSTPLSIKFSRNCVVFNNMHPFSTLHISIFDLAGKVIASGNCRNTNVFYLKKHIDPGCYIIKISDGVFKISRAVLLTSTK